MIYKEYLQRRKNGCSKTSAKKFGGSRNINDTLVPKWLFDDVDDTCRELSKEKLLNIAYADDICYIVELSDNGISYMQHRFGDKLEKIVDYITRIGSLVP